MSSWRGLPGTRCSRSQLHPCPVWGFEPRPHLNTGDGAETHVREPGRSQPRPSPDPDPVTRSPVRSLEPGWGAPRAQLLPVAPGPGKGTVQDHACPCCPRTRGAVSQPNSPWDLDLTGCSWPQALPRWPCFHTHSGGCLPEPCHTSHRGCCPS